MHTYYQNTPQVWDAKKCNRMARRTARDGLGTPYPFKGYIGSHYGRVRYNGGCLRDGQLYDGEEFPLPIIADGFSIIRIRTWGWQIIKNY